MSTSLTDQQAANAAHVEGLAPPGTRVRLDLSDDRQYEHAVAMHTLTGQTPEKFPGLHKALALAREAHIEHGPPLLTGADPNGFATGAVISEISRVSGTDNAGAAGFSSILGGAPMLANTLVIKDRQARVLAGGSSQQYGDGTYLGVTTATDTALPVASSMVGILQYTYQPTVGAPVIVESVTVTDNLTATADPVIRQPVKRAGTPGPQLRIGLGRGGGDVSDVDYWFWQGQSSTTYALPLETDIAFDGVISTPLADNLNIAGYLGRGQSAPDPGPKGGILPISFAQIVNILHSSQVSGGQLTVTMPAATSPTDQGNPIVWGPAPWDTSELTFFYIQFTVNLDGQMLPAVASIMSSKDQDVDPLDGIATIPPIQYVFHCLAAGTQITLDDGTTASVQDLTADHAVRGGDGQAVPVVSTVLGNHTGEVVQLQVGERQLVLSHGHLVITPSGPVLAAELRAGDEVLVDDGTATVTKATREQFDGILANASLHAPGEPADAGRGTMLANGIRVGDYELQVQDAQQRRTDPERILSVLDPLFHDDFREHAASAVA